MKKMLNILKITLKGTIPADGVWITKPQIVNVEYNFMLVDDVISVKDRKFLQVCVTFAESG